MPASPNAANKPGRARDDSALMLRASGKPYREIAATIGVSVGAAHKAVRRATARLPDEPLAVLRRVHAERLERLIEAGWEAAVAGDLDAIETCRKLLADTARLLGLERPVRVQIDPPIKPEWSTW